MRNELENINVFLGEEGCKNYIDPTKHAPTSVVELPSSFILAHSHFLKKDRVRVVLKMMSETAFSTIKTIPVVWWYKGLEAAHKINEKTVTVINSSGGAGLPFVVIGLLFGVRHFVVFMPEDANQNKRKLIKRAGGKAVTIIETTETGNDKESFWPARWRKSPIMKFLTNTRATSIPSRKKWSPWPSYGNNSC